MSEKHPRLSASLAYFHPPTTATTTGYSSKGHCQHHQEQQQQQQIKFYCADSPNNFVEDTLIEQNDEQCSISTQSQTIKSFSNTTDRTVVTHSMTKSDASCMDHDTENLKSIVEEEHFMGDDVLMDDASAHSFDIPDLDQWEIRGFEDGEEDANSQCSVVALDGGEDDLLEPLNLSCFSDQGDNQKKKKWQQQQQPVINEHEDLPQSTPFASWGQADGAKNSSQVSPHSQAVLKSHNAANLTSSSFATFPSSENQTATWSSTPSMVQSSNCDSSSSMAFYPGMGYDTYRGSSDMLAGQYHPHPHQGYSTTTNDQISRSVHSQPSGDNFHNGWTEIPSAMMHQSDPHEMLQARLGLSSFRPVDQFGSNYEQFSRASSVHALTYSAENVDMKQRYGTVSVASAPAGTSWNRNGGNVHMRNHHGNGEGAYTSSMHHGYGKRRGHSASTMSVHSMDYPRRSSTSTNGPSSLHEYPTYNNAFHGGHGGMHSSHHPLENPSSVFSAASGSYPPSAPSSSYYQEHHPNTEEQIIPMSSSGQHENNHDFHNADSPILHGTAVVNEMDKNLATNFSYAVLYEVESCSFESRDRTGKRRGLELGFQGLACRHCKGVAKKIGGRLFPSSIKTMSDTQKTLIPLYKHLIKCPSVPNETKERLYSLKDLHENERQNKTYGSQKAFFTEIWRRLHGKIPKDGK